MPSVTQVAPSTSFAGITSANVTFSSTPASGATIEVSLSGWESGTFNTTSVTDSVTGSPNSYSEDEAGTATGGYSVQHWRSSNITTEASFQITANFGGSANYGSFTAIEVDSADNTGQPNASGSNTETSGTDANASTSGATTLADCVVICNCSFGGDSDVGFGANPTTGYTTAYTEINGALYGGAQCGYKVVSVTGTQTANWTHDNADNSASIVALGETAYIRENYLVTRTRNV